ncbi:MAG: 4Fe-4S binding protein [Thermoleophilia bacterium]|nr:4Fe-4S binding protein [Thermoleophilia bacterium]
MRTAVVSTYQCTGHDRCPARKNCPTRALTQMDPGETAVVNQSLCRGCGDCVKACPERAIILQDA